MNLVSFSIKTKGLHNFVRRLATVFARFGLSERQTRQALYTIIETLEPYAAIPTFFIPAVVLDRHPGLLAEIAGARAEIGMHGYVHNDYRTLSHAEQYKQTEKAISVFEERQIPFQGFRNPYLGWTEASLSVFTQLGFRYDSNDAVLHDVVDLDAFSPLLRSGYEKSFELFQAIERTAYTLRPYFVGKLLRIPTSIPDDEMLFDRLRITNTREIGRIWSSIMERVYDLGGIYVLNLHPERGVLCQFALRALLASTLDVALPIWVTNLMNVAQWWKERTQFRLNITPLAPDHWQVEASCSRATLLARHIVIEDAPTILWHGADVQVLSERFSVHAAQCPCIGLSYQTSEELEDFLCEQGYPFVRCSEVDAQRYACYLDMPEGLGKTRKEQIRSKSELLSQLMELEAPLVYYGCWPNGCRSALSITGDIDSVTIQDFFRRVVEV